jgi:hypothetical protein
MNYSRKSAISVIPNRFLMRNLNRISLPINRDRNDNGKIDIRKILIVICYFTFGIFLNSCGSSVTVPSKEESEKKTAELKPAIDSLDLLISVQTKNLPKGYDIISRTRLSAIDMLLDRVATIDKRDIHIDFLQTRPLWREDKSVLGMSYTNYVDIDTGALDIDLKKFRFLDFTSNIVNAQIEIEGEGNIRVSGKYTGVAASTTPHVNFYLNEMLQFAITVADSDYIKLTPLPNTVLLKTKVTIKLLGWEIPYYKEIPLKATELIKPVLVPSALRSEIVFPIPASQFGEQKLEFVKRYIDFTKTTVNANNNILEFRGNIDFEKE